MAFSLGDIFVTIKAKTDQLEAGLARVSASATEVGNKVAPASAGLQKLQDVAKVVAVGVAAATTAFVGLAGAGIKGAGEFEQSRIAFETMLGSADKARKMMKDISDFAKSTPFELPEVVAASKQLLAFGFAQEQIIPTMKMLGDIASGVGVPVGQLSYVFGQVRVAGKLMGGDLMQFTNAGVPMIEGLSKVLNVSQADVKKMVEEGKVGFPEVQKVMENLTGEGGRFGGMMDKQSHSLNGVISNIKDGFGQALRSMVGLTNEGDIVAGGLFDRVKTGAEKLMPIVQQLGDKVGPFMIAALSDVSKAFGIVFDISKKVADVLATTYEWFNKHKVVAAALGGAIMGAMIPAMIALVIMAGSAIVAFGAWAIAAGAAALATIIALAPFIAIGAVVGAIVFLIIKYWSDITAAFAAMWSFIVAGWNDIVAVATTVWNGIWAVIKPIVDFIIGYFQLMWTIYSYIFAVMWGLAQVIWGQIWNLIKPILDAIGAALSWLGGVFASVFGWIGNVASSVWNGIVSGFTWAKDKVVGVWNTIADFFKGIWDKISGTVGGVAGAISNAFSGAFEGAKNILKSGVNWMIDQVNKVIRAVNNSAGKLPGVPDIPQIAKLFTGVHNFVGGLALVGEQGAELVNLGQGDDVYSHNQTRQMLANAGAGGSNQRQVVINLDGANITSPHVADQYGEQIGNAIVRRLMQNVRL